MKIGILTQPLLNNYGCLLQNYALQQVLKKLEFDSITIDQKSEKYSILHLFLGRLKAQVLHLLFPSKYGKPLYIPSEEETAFIEKNTRSFIDHYICRTSKCEGTEDFINAVVNNNIDILVVGSDQCWRPLYNNYLDDMFLQFAEHLPIKKRIAYAASFGTDVWEYKESLTEKCAKLVKYFDVVTVREDSGVKLCKEYLCVNAFHVLDPTMLLQREDYLKILEKSNTPKSDGNLFDYILDPNPIKQQFVKNVASRFGLQSFHVLPKYNEDYRTRENVKKHLEECVYPSPLAWLAAFRDSKMTIVDSFHGMVFSIIFNVPFWVIGNPERGMSRFVSLLKIFGLEDRLISINDLNSMDLNRSIDWEHINNVLSIKRIDSYQILENALK